MNSRCFQQLDEGYDEEYGGFAEAPKFPTPGQCPPPMPASPQPGLLMPVLAHGLVIILPFPVLPSCQELSHQDLTYDLSSDPDTDLNIALLCSGVTADPLTPSLSERLPCCVKS